MSGARAALAGLSAFLLALVVAAPASASFPYTRSGGDPSDPTDLYLDAGTVPTDLGGNEFKFAATPDPANTVNNLLPVELGGVRGAHVVDDDASVSTAFRTTTGRPDVTIAILDSGIKWNDAGAMTDLRKKTRLSKGELPKPRNDGLGTPNEPGADCSGGGPFTHAGDWDLNGDAVFNVIDYACDNRVQRDTPKGVGPAGVLEPQDILIAFSDGVDDDGNGYVDDIVGWDFLDNDNDPFDDVQYGHGTGEARDSTAEADNGGDVGSCPNCMGIYLRVGDSFIGDVNRFGAAVTYATDNDAQIVQEALGTLNNASLAREAVDYAYRHGVVVMASAADEAAQHNNWPSTLPHVIVANSVTDSDVASPNKSYLAFNGCTNFSAKITVAIPSTSCSSNAVGLAAGYAGLIYSAALNAREAGVLGNYPDTSACELTSGDPCPITPNEIRQVLASGTYGGTGQVDDVNFAGAPAGSGNEPSCSPTPLPDCTSPYGPAGLLQAQVEANRPALASPPLGGSSYPARKGHDQFYGYGRANMNRAVDAVIDDPASPGTTALPPEAEILSPEWFGEVDPGQGSLAVEGEVFARGAPYRCQLLVAPGQYPNNALTTDSPPGDFEELSNGYCDGSTVHNGAAAASSHRGTLGTIDIGHLKSRFPAGTDFNGPIPQPTAATGNGRPFFAPHAFTFKVVVTPTSGPARTGEDERTSYLHHDRDLLDGFPRTIQSEGRLGSGSPSADGDSSPAFADLDGDNRNELILATSDGFVHAIHPDGTELLGWPVRGDRPSFVDSHVSAPAYASGAVGSDLGAAFLGAVAVGDTDGDGVPEVYAADFEGRLYGWGPDGKRVFTEATHAAYSGKPLAPFENVRNGKTNRTQRGFFGSPVLADLDGDGDEEIVAAAMDRHVYAWDGHDSDPGAAGGAAEQPGFPVLVVDPAKVQSIDPTTHAVTFRGDAGSYQQGAIIDTPAVGDITGDARPEIVIGTNEEYDEPFNVGNAGTLGILAATGLFDPGNSRVYALQPDGDRDSDPMPNDAIAPGWPFRPGLLLTELLPVVGEGVSGPPVIGPVNCPSGGAGNKVGTASAAGPAYIVNGDGSSCHGQTLGSDNALATDFTAGATVTDTPIIPAVGNPAFGAAGLGSDGDHPSLVLSSIGLFRALDLQASEYQGGQDLIGAWDPASGQFRANYPATMNDLQFLTGPAVADIGGPDGEEVLAGSSSADLAAYDASGLPVSGWPKLSTDWTVATPLVGSFGTTDTDGDARKVVVGITRSGYVHAYKTSASACSPSSSPRFHHDNANSGDYSRDAVLPGVPGSIATNDERTKVRFDAPGDDLLCGTADHYELATGDEAIDSAGFAGAKPIKAKLAPEPVAPGERQSFDVPEGSERFLAVRAVDEQGNVGRTVSVRVKPNPGGGGKACATTIRGTKRGDRLQGTNGGDRIRGGAGNDRIKARGGDDCVAGYGGKDKIKGNGGDDKLKGGGGKDHIAGGGGKDKISGGGGKDVIKGGGGKDKIKVRGGGRDRVNCGGGKDKVIADRRDKVAKNCEKVKRK